MSERSLPPGVLALIALFAITAVINVTLFVVDGYNWDKLVIAVLFVTLALNVKTIENYKQRVTR